MAAQVILETQGRDEAAHEIRERLLGFNQEQAGPFQDVRVVLTVRGAGASSAAESQARKRGWQVCFLSSWTFQAPGSHRRLGYEPFGELKGMPPGQTRTWFAEWLS